MAVSFDVGESLPTVLAGPVRLRWLTVDDVPALFTVFSDPDVTRYFGLRTPSLDDAQRLVGEIHEAFHARTLFQWGVEHDGTIVGTCTLAHLDAQNRRAELGFALGKAHWGQGIMTSATRALLAFAFESLALHRLYADADPRNASSLRLLARLGFQREGYVREHYWVEDEAQDGVMFGLLRPEWRARV